MLEKATMESKTKATMCKSIKTVSEIGVQNDFTFCLEPPIEKINSGMGTSFGHWSIIKRILYTKTGIHNNLTFYVNWNKSKGIAEKR